VDFLKNPITQCVLLMAVLAVMLAVSYWGLRRFRDYIGQDQTLDADLLTNYRELHEQGIITDAEYRTIKSRLNARMQRESDRSGHAG